MVSQSLERSLAALTAFLDRFIPPQIAARREQRDCARVFLVSHVFGPFLGNVLPLYLLFTGYERDYRLVVFFASITVFWVFPFALRAFGQYRLLVTLSVQNLIFTIFWACFNYGGVSSPFLPWAATIPLLAFFYVGRANWMVWTLPALLGANLAAFGGLLMFEGGAFPPVNLDDFHIIGILSIVSASCYVAMMALYHASVFNSQVELEREVRDHLETAANLQRTVTEIERAGVAKSEFVANMSHELRTPLNAVIGYSQLVLEESSATLPESMLTDITMIKDAGAQLLRIVNNILDLSKIDAGKMDLVLETLGVNDFLSQVVEENRAQMEERGNVVLMLCARELGQACWDFTLVSSALTNVLDNAGKYTENGTILISAERRPGADGDEIAISCRDTGAGIAENCLETIFDAFAAGADENDTQYGGVALGLTLTRKICHLLGGEVSVESVLGEGSKFTLTFPVQPKSSQRGDADENGLETRKAA